MVGTLFVGGLSVRLVRVAVPRLLVGLFVAGVASALAGGAAQAATIAAWDFNTLVGSGSPPTTLQADIGTGTLYLNGTNGSSAWSPGQSPQQLTAFAGTITNLHPSTIGGAGQALAPVNLSANGQSAVFAFSMTGRKDLVLSYATRNTLTGFQTQTWAYSTNGVDFIPIAPAFSGLTTSFTLKFITPIALDNAATAYLRVTFTGATDASGNNRLDNIQLTAITVPLAEPAFQSAAFSPNAAYSGTATTLALVLKNNSATTAATGITATIPNVDVQLTPGTMPAGCSFASSQITCTTASLPANTAQTFNIPFTVKAVPTANSVALAVTVTTTGTDSNTGNNSGSATLTIQRCGDGVRQTTPAEGCDDGNANNLDGCTNACVESPNWNCTEDVNGGFQSCVCVTGTFPDVNGTCAYFDFGDAGDPDSGGEAYNTSFTPSSCRHLRELDGPKLGAFIDYEAGGAPSLECNSDGADDDGVTVLPTFTIGRSASFDIDIDGGILSAFELMVYIDFNRNGVFEGSELFAFSDQSEWNVNTRKLRVTGVVPAGAIPGFTAMRVRVATTLSGIEAIGRASDGEVEDYRVTVADLCAGVNTNDNDVCTADACDPLTGNVSHTLISVDDNNVCTTDLCDPINGASHPLISFDDNNACTTDTCDPISGLAHTNNQPGFIDDGSHTCAQYDFGDAGKLTDGSDSYGTLLPNGARHVVTVNGPLLGASVTTEVDGQPGADADNDNDNGVPTLPQFTLDTSNFQFVVSVLAVAGATYNIKAWVDFSGDGVFDDATELFGSLSTANDTGGVTTKTLSGDVPAAALLGFTAMRIRVASVLTGIGPSGRALDGEVEDYVVSVASLCGNGALDAGEDCDDDDGEGGDGCDGLCDFEDGWSCDNTPMPSTCVRIIDLAVATTALSQVLVQGGSATVSVSVTNTSSTVATGVVIHAGLPTGLTFTSADLVVGSYATSTGLWTVGHLTAGAVATLTLHATVASGQMGKTVMFAANVEALSEIDPVADNDADSVRLHTPYAIVAGGVNIGFDGFVGAGFEKIPSAGKLSSLNWSLTGFGPELGFEGTSTDPQLARGVSDGNAVSSGIYASETAPGNPAFGIEPDEDVGTPGTINLRLVNVSGAPVQRVRVSYRLAYFNHGDVRNTVNFSYSSGGAGSISRPEKFWQSTDAATTPPVAWVGTDRVGVLDGLALAAGGVLELSWITDRNFGVGAHDQIALDDITIAVLDADASDRIYYTESVGGTVVVPFGAILADGVKQPIGTGLDFGADENRSIKLIPSPRGNFIAYNVSGNDTNTWGVVNPLTGVFTARGVLTEVFQLMFGEAPVMGLDEAGDLYAFGFIGSSQFKFGKYNVDTGAFTTILSGVDAPYDYAYSFAPAPGGGLYYTGQAGGTTPVPFGIINTTTGARTPIGPGLDFAEDSNRYVQLKTRPDGTLFGFDLGDSGGGGTRTWGTIDPVAEAFTAIGDLAAEFNLGFGGDLSALGFTASGKLLVHGFIGSSTYKLGTLSTSTGAFTAIELPSSYDYAYAFASPPIVDCGNLDDGNPCTTNVFNPDTGTCGVNVTNGTEVPDLDLCDGTETCQNGVVTNGSALTCSTDNNPCTTDECNPATGACWVNVSDGPIASDTDKCDGTSSCTAGVFNAGSTVTCAPDSNVCTTEACVEATGDCASTNVSDGPIASDTNKCDGTSTCVAGVQGAGTAPVINDGDACTTDACTAAGGVTHTAVATDDGNLCTTDSCDPTTGIAHVAVVIDDGDACTTDACAPATGVTHVAVATDDQDACTVDSCDAATGVKHVALVCNDNNACTTDSCNPATGCTTTLVIGPTAACSNNGTCSQGGAGPAACSCDDGNFKVDCSGVCPGGEGALQCGGHGTCTDGASSAVGTCNCAAGYYIGVAANGLSGVSSGPTVCSLTRCGDGFEVGSETCDDGNTSVNDACPSGPAGNCREATCGDGFVLNSGLTPNNASNARFEECDAGAGNSNAAANACRTSCRRASCGDGVVDTGEQCDDRNKVDGDGCSASCVAGTVGDSDGDGWLDAAETACGTDPDDNDSNPTAAGADRDGDTLCDAQDTDDDGDGWSDVDEVLCGTDGRVASGVSGVPGDADGDGTCDEVDADDDNDGASDAIELACGTDPEDASETPLAGDGDDLDGDGAVSCVDGDDDGDGVSDVNERAIGSNPRVKDTDGDGLEDGAENADKDGVIDATETSPLTKDTDQDGIDDDVEAGSRFPTEVEGETLPTRGYLADSDGDGLSDGQEDMNHNGRLNAGETNPRIADSDGDGAGDGEETRCATDALAPGSLPVDRDDDGECDGAQADGDRDGVADGVEVFCGTDPADDGSTPSPDDLADADDDGQISCVDSDDDGDRYLDVDEIVCGTAPRDRTSLPSQADVADHDGDTSLNCVDADDDDDGVSDVDEIAAGTGPRDSDSDDDGLSDGDEKALGTSPLLADSDGDGVQDGTERGLESGTADTDLAVFVPDADPGSKTDPKVGDSDGDGLGDGDEDANHNGRVDQGETDPLVPEVTVDDDRDGDGLSNAAELVLGTDPDKADTDGDGLDDKVEVDLGTRPLVRDSDGGGVDDGAEVANGTDPNKASDDRKGGVASGGEGCAAGGGAAGLALGMLALIGLAFGARRRARSRVARCSCRPARAA